MSASRKETFTTPQFNEKISLPFCKIEMGRRNNLGKRTPLKTLLTAKKRPCQSPKKNDMTLIGGQNKFEGKNNQSDREP